MDSLSFCRAGLWPGLEVPAIGPASDMPGAPVRNGSGRGAAFEGDRLHARILFAGGKTFPLAPRAVAIGGADCVRERSADAEFTPVTRVACELNASRA
jgi:hypothetical protein